MHSLLRRNAPQTGVAVFQTISVWGLTYLFLLKMVTEFLKVFNKCETILSIFTEPYWKLKSICKLEGILEELSKRLNPFEFSIFLFRRSGKRRKPMSWETNIYVALYLLIWIEMALKSARLSSTLNGCKSLQSINLTQIIILTQHWRKPHKSKAYQTSVPCGY